MACAKPGACRFIENCRYHGTLATHKREVDALLDLAIEVVDGDEVIQTAISAETEVPSFAARHDVLDSTSVFRRGILLAVAVQDNRRIARIFPMHPLTSTLVRDFEVNKGTDALGATIAEIAGLMEKVHGWGHGLDSREQMAQFAWTERVAQFDRADMPTGDLELLIELLCEFVLQAPTDPWVTSATWALGKTRQANIKPVLIAALRLQVYGNPNAMYQTMIALQNMGERPFGDYTCLSSLDVEESRQAALRYLLQN